MADGGAANADAVISGALLTVAFGFLPCVAARQLLATTRQLKDLDREELWRQCYLSQYPERSCKAAVPSLWRLAMRQPQNGRICLDSSDPAIDSGAHDWQAAILVTGSPLSGKTWLVQRFCTGHPPEGLNKVPFLGTDLRVSRVQMRSQPSTFTRGRVRIWEPSGLSRQQALTGYLKAAQAVLVCLDVASDGPEDARRLLGEVTQSMRPGTIVGLGGLQDKLTPRQQRQAFAALKPVAQEANAEHSDEWGRDPLLQYRFLPFEHLKGTLGKGIRAVFLTFLFYGNIAAVVMPVVLVLVFAVCQDGVHAAVRADLLRRDAGQHHYLLDFIVAPSFFRFWSLDLEMQILQGAAVLYVFLVGATIAYCMVLRSIPRLKPFEPFFGYADHAIRCVTYVLISAFILFVTNTLMWVVLGSLIRPADLLPYAIMVGMAATVTQSMLTKFKGMQQFCSSKMVSLLDKALLAIFKVMAKDLKGRNGFLQEEHEAFQKLQIDVWQKLREIEEAEEKQMASMVRKAHTSDKAEEFLRSIRLTSDAPVPRKGSSMLQVQDRTDGLAQDKEKQVKNLSKSLSLHSDTVGGLRLS
eukprot:g30398.t1